jgi:hypothetical protein
MTRAAVRVVNQEIAEELFRAFEAALCSEEVTHMHV